MMFSNWCIDYLINLVHFLKKGFSKFGVFALKTLCSSQLMVYEVKLDNFNALEYASYVHSSHASYRLLFIKIFVL